MNKVGCFIPARSGVAPDATTAEAETDRFVQAVVRSGMDTIAWARVDPE